MRRGRSSSTPSWPPRTCPFSWTAASLRASAGEGRRGDTAEPWRHPFSPPSLNVPSSQCALAPLCPPPPPPIPPCSPCSRLCIDGSFLMDPLKRLTLPCEGERGGPPLGAPAAPCLPPPPALHVFFRHDDALQHVGLTSFLSLTTHAGLQRFMSLGAAWAELQWRGGKLATLTGHFSHPHGGEA